MKSFIVLFSLFALACETPVIAYDKNDETRAEQDAPDAGEETKGVEKNSIMEKLEDAQFEPADQYEDGLPVGEFKPAFPTIYWEFDDFVDVLNEDVVIINFDALPAGPAVAPGFDQVTHAVTGAPLSGEEWRDLGAVFSSTAEAALRTVSRIDFCCPDGTPTVDLFVSRPNSLTIGAAPYTAPLDPADNEGVVDENDDSLIIDLVTPKAAVGFYLIDQDGTDVNESIIFRDVNGAVIKTIQPLPTAIYPSHQFIGLLSFTRPIAQVEIVEMDNNGDDISIDHVVLSN